MLKKASSSSSSYSSNLQTTSGVLSEMEFKNLVKYGGKVVLEPFQICGIDNAGR